MADKSPRTISFFSDNTSTVCPEIFSAIAEANVGAVASYSEDPWSLRLDSVFSEFFKTDVRAFVVATGTAANALSLSTIVPGGGLIFAHELAHILIDECGASEFYSDSAQIVPIAGDHGRINPAALTAAINAAKSQGLFGRGGAVSLTQLTEFGAVYSLADIREMSAIASENGLSVYMDGARFANAVVSLDCNPADVTWRAGVDVLSFGATKNGAMAAEAVVFFNKDLVGNFEFRRQRGGHLVSKSRFISAQLLAYIETGVWRRNAEHANRLAGRIAKSGKRFLLHPVEGNELFMQLGDERKQRLRDTGFGFFDWGEPDSGEARFLVSWDQSEEDVEALCSALESLSD